MSERKKPEFPLRCPYCDRRFNMSRRRYEESYWARRKNELPITECRGCGKRFYYRNMSASYARKYGIRATFTIEEVQHFERLMGGYMFFLARYLKDDVPHGKEYTFKADFPVNVGDVVRTSNGKRVIAVAGEVNEDFIREYGEDNFVAVQPLEEDKAHE